MLRFRPYLIVAFGTIVPLSGRIEVQTPSILDQGTFIVSRNGTTIGRESFRVLRAPGPGGQMLRATGQSAIGDERAETTLGTDSLGVPLSYDNKVYTRGELTNRVRGLSSRPGRFSVFLQTKGGESAREYVLNNGALLMDDGVFHHFYFIPIASSHDHVLVIAPRSGQQERFALQDLGADPVRVATKQVDARHLALKGADGESRDVWVDDKGRLLKVALPAHGLVALRDELPR
jgi:hypothetical protein